MDLGLSEKVAIVTGASRGIGKAVAEKLSAEGMNLDLRRPTSASQVITAAIQKFGGLDLLVNNAGATKRGDFLQLTEEEWTDLP